MTSTLHETVPAVSGWLLAVPNIVLVLAYVFIVWEKIPKVVVALLGASTVLLLQVLSQQEALQAIDFNVIALLVGMMILVNILKQTGALNALALMAARCADGSGLRLMLIFSVLTAVLSAALDNVTTVLLLGTVTITVTRYLKLNPIPFLVSETIMSNVGGTATLIGDPPNIMIGSAAGLSFNDFLIHLAPIIFLVISPISLTLLALIYRKDLKLGEDAKTAMSQLSLEGVITDRPLMMKAIVVIGLVLTGFLFHHNLGLEAGTIALAGAAVLMVFENRNSLWDDVEWTTIFFFIGLFVMVGAVEKVGTLDWLAQTFLQLSGGSYPVVAMLLLWISGIFSAIIDNIPYTATMIPLVKNLQTLDPIHFADLNPLWWSLALGACLGGNGTLVGAMANVLVADMANREGYPIRFVSFMAIGGLIMMVSLFIATGYIYLRYLI